MHLRPHLTFPRTALPMMASSVLLFAACQSGTSATSAAGMGHGVNPLLSSSVRLERAAPEKTFSVLWWTKVEGTEQRPYHPVELAAPATDARRGIVFTATRDGYLTAFSQTTRERLWEVRQDGPFNAGPLLDASGSLLSRELLFSASAGGKLDAFDPATGEKIWSYSTPEAFMTTPVAAGDFILVMTAADTLVALDKKSGAWRWHYKRDMPRGLSLFGAARPAVKDGKVYAGFADGYAVALELSSGALVWEKELSRARAFRDLDASPVIDAQGNVLFTSGSDGLFCLDGATGDIKWSHLRPGLTAAILNAAGDRVFVGGQSFVAMLETGSGRVRWARDLRTGTAVTALANANGQLIASCGAEPMIFIEEETGRVRREFQPGHGVTAPASVSEDGDLFILSNRGYLYALAIHP